LTIRGSSTVGRKITVAYYAVPALIFTSLAVSNYIHVSFGVYLKYQGLVDGYHQHRLDTKYESMLDQTKEENIVAGKISKSESILSLNLRPPMGEPSKH